MSSGRRPRRRTAARTLLCGLVAAAACLGAPQAAGALETGVNIGNGPVGELPYVRALGARSVRVELPIGTSAAGLRDTFATFGEAGIRPLVLAGFEGRVPTAEEARGLADWAAAYGPGGTFWTTHPGEATSALTHIEFGNESSYPTQWPGLAADPDWALTRVYRGYATGYALRFRDAALAVRATGRPVGLLAFGEVPGRWPTWYDALFAAVPDFGSYVGGWSAHPYGPRWRSSLDFLVAEARRKGAPDRPIFVTETGVANDGGRCLDQNFGHDRCSGSASAARALTRATSGMRKRYGARLAGIWTFHAHDLRPSGASRGSIDYFGALTAAGRSKGAYTAAVKRLLRLR